MGSRDDREGEFEKIISCSIGQVRQRAGGIEIEIGRVVLVGDAIALHPGFVDTPQRSENPVPHRAGGELPASATPALL